MNSSEKYKITICKEVREKELGCPKAISHVYGIYERKRLFVDVLTSNLFILIHSKND